MNIEKAQVRVLRQRLKKAEQALEKIGALTCNGALDEGLHWYQRRDIAFNAFKAAQQIAKEGLLP